MAVTTEPPWLHSNAVSAPRNGTTSHVISFGFTPTAGSLLVAYVYGAVTHSASGWTELQQPVGTGELSLFTKTAAGTAGQPSTDTSITVTHGAASNYPVQAWFGELPAGSATLDSDAVTDSSETFPTLSGLTTAEKLIIAARGRVPIGSESGASTAWPGPWVEDADLFAAAAATDGSYLTVAHQINNTSAGVTPSATTTYSGTWGAADRQKAFIVVNAVAPLSGVSAVATVRAATTASASVRKAVAVAARCTAAAITRSAARRVLPATLRAVAAASPFVAVRRVATPAVRVCAAGSITAATAKRFAATCGVTAVAGVTVSATSGTARPAAARCAAAPTARAATGRISRVAGSVTAAPVARSAAIHRTVAAGSVTALAATGTSAAHRARTSSSAAALATARSATNRRFATVARVVGVVSAVSAASQLGSSRPAVGRCLAAATCLVRIRHAVSRPDTGTISRPSNGVISRPFSGFIARP